MISGDCDCDGNERYQCSDGWSRRKSLELALIQAGGDVCQQGATGQGAGRAETASR